MEFVYIEEILRHLLSIPSIVTCLCQSDSGATSVTPPSRYLRQVIRMVHVTNVLSIHAAHETLIFLVPYRIFLQDLSLFSSSFGVGSLSSLYLSCPQPLTLPELHVTDLALNFEISSTLMCVPYSANAPWLSAYVYPLSGVHLLINISCLRRVRVRNHIPISHHVFPSRLRLHSHRPSLHNPSTRNCYDSSFTFNRYKHPAPARLFVSLRFC